MFKVYYYYISIVEFHSKCSQEKIISFLSNFMA